MAVGSNTLGLLFKIGVDAGDAEKQVSGLGKVISDLGSSFKEGFGAGAAQGAKDIETATTGVGNAFKQLITPVNQSVQGFREITDGNFTGGFTSLARSLGPVGLAIAAAAVAAYGAVKAFEQMVEVSDKIGTTSKDDFEEFQKALEAVGVTLTKTDQVIAQQLNKSFADLKATTDSLFLVLLRTTGPALVVLIREISGLLVGFGPALDIIGRFISANLIQAAAVLEVIGKFIKALKEDASGTFFNFDFVKEFTDALARVRAATAAVPQTALIPFEPGTFRAAAKEVDEFAKALAAAQKELDKLRQTTADIIIQNVEDQLKELNQAILDVTDIKKIAAFKFEMVDFANLVTKEIDSIVQDFARLGKGIPGGGTGIPGLPDDETIQKGLDDAFKHYESFFEKIKTGAASVGQTLTDRLTKALEDLPINLIDAFTKSFENLLDTFVQTGHTGPAVLKQFVAAVLRQLGTMAAQFAAISFALALFYLATQDYKDAALATLAGIGFTAIAVGLGFAAGKVAPSSAGAAAGAGGFGGDAAPGTVTINQSAPSGLGIQLQQLNALNNISNTLTTASPGDVVTRGAEQNPVAIGQANNEAARRDGTVSREFLQISGLRTA